MEEYKGDLKYDLIPYQIFLSIDTIRLSLQNDPLIFKKRAESKQVNKVMILMNLNKEFKYYDPVIAVDIIKTYLRSLPEPLLTFDLIPKMIECVTEDKINDISKYLDELPLCNKALLYCLMEVCNLNIKIVNEDEFLEFGAGHLSKKLLGQIAEWKEEVLEIQVPEEFDAERAAGQILWEMEHVWNCRYVSEEAVEIVQKNRDDVRWQKALLAFRKYMNAYQEYFPELPPELVTEQILVRERDYYCRTIMAAFWALMMNETLRQDTFRF